MVMRGTKSISGNNNALYVVDGVPLANISGEQPDDQYTGAGQSGDGLANFNADDIESISVLSGSSPLHYTVRLLPMVWYLSQRRKEAVDKTRLTYSNNSTFYSPFRLPEFQNTYGSETGEWYSWASKLSSPTDYEVKDFFSDRLQCSKHCKSDYRDKKKSNLCIRRCCECPGYHSE